MDGNERFLRLPRYYVPTLDLRLFSPQDYAPFHRLQLPKTYSGNANLMEVQILRDDDAKPSDRAPILAKIDPSLRIPFMHAEVLGPSDAGRMSPPRDDTEVPVAQVTLHDPRNGNLSHSQKLLKRDHDSLAHIDFWRLQALYHERKTIPNFDGTSTSTDVCLPVSD